jgi:hypothetical protein
MSAYYEEERRIKNWRKENPLHVARGEENK